MKGTKYMARPWGVGGAALSGSVHEEDGLRKLQNRGDSLWYWIVTRAILHAQ